PVNGFLYNLRAACPPRDLHKEEKWDHFARGLGLAGAAGPIRYVLDPAEEGWAAGWLREHGVPDSPAPVGAFIGARGSKGKKWPAGRFLEVPRLLAAGGRPVLVFLGPEEAALAPGLAAAIPPGAFLVFEPSIRRAAALIARTGLFVTGDSGPMHLACALGVPVLALFLKDNWRRWGPRPGRGRVLQLRETTTAAEVAALAGEMLLEGPVGPGGAVAYSPRQSDVQSVSGSSPAE